MANERYLQIVIKFDPDLTKHVKRTRGNYTDAVTGEEIPKGTSCYKLSYRYGSKLYAVYVSESTYQKLTP